MRSYGALALLTLAVTASLARADVVELTAENFAETVSADGGWKVWAVLFKDESDESAAYEKVFGDLSKKAKDMLSVGVVDTSSEAGAKLAAAEGYTKGEAATLLRAYAETPLSSDAGRVGAVVAETEASIGPMYKAFTEFLPSDLVTKIEGTEHLQQFFQGHKRALQKVFLFTKKGDAPPLYRALAKTFQGQLDLCVVGSQDAELVQQFNVKKFPYLLVMSGAKAGPDGRQELAMQPYPGKKFSFAGIKKFMGRYGKVPALATIKDQAAYEAACGSGQCGIVLMPQADLDANKAVLDRLAKHYQGDMVTFFAVDAAKAPNASALMGVEGPMIIFTGAVVYDDQGAVAYTQAAIPAAGALKAAAASTFFDKSLESLITTIRAAIKIKDTDEALEVAEGLTEAEGLPALFGEATVKAKKAKKLKKALKNPSAVFNMSKPMFDSLVRPSAHVWLVLSCPGGVESDACAAATASYAKVAKKLRGIVWCAAMDRADAPVPEGASASAPSLYAFPHTKEAKAEEGLVPEAFEGEIEPEAVTKWAQELLPNTLRYLDVDTFQSWVQGQYDSSEGKLAPSTIVLYNDKTEEAIKPLLRSMSYHSPKAAIGMLHMKDGAKVPGFDFKGVVKQLGLPTILGLVAQPDPNADPEEEKKAKKAGKGAKLNLGFQPYQGKWGFQGLSRFFKQIAPESSLDDIMPDPTVYTMAKVTELTHELSAAAACGEARICVIGLLDKLDPHFEKTHMGMLQSLALRQAAKGAKDEMYGETPVVWLDAGNQPDYVQAFGVSSLPTVVVWSPSAEKYTQLLGSFDMATVAKLVDKSVRYTKRTLKSTIKELPKLQEAAAPLPVEEEMDLSDLMGDIIGGGDDAVAEDDDDDGPASGVTERGPARFNKKKKKKKKKGGFKKKKKKKGKKGKKGKKDKKEL